MYNTALPLPMLVIFFCLVAQALPSEDLALKLKIALSDADNAESLNEISDQSVVGAYNKLYGKFAETISKDDSTLKLKTKKSQYNPANVKKIKKYRRTFNDVPAKSKVVAYNKSYGKFAGAISKDDSTLKLKTALNDHENADNFNEISQSFEMNPGEMGVVILDPSSFEYQVTPKNKNEIMTTYRTTKAPTVTADGRGSHYREQANSSSLSRRMLGFISSWMQMRHLLRLAS